MPTRVSTGTAKDVEASKEKSRLLVDAHLKSNASDFPQRGLCTPVSNVTVDDSLTFKQTLDVLRQQAAVLNCAKIPTNNRRPAGGLPRTPPKNRTSGRDIIIDLSNAPRVIESQLRVIAAMHDTSLPSCSKFRPPSLEKITVKATAIPIADKPKDSGVQQKRPTNNTPVAAARQSNSTNQDIIPAIAATNKPNILPDMPNIEDATEHTEDSEDQEEEPGNNDYKKNKVNKKKKKQRPKHLMKDFLKTNIEKIPSTKPPPNTNLQYSSAKKRKLSPNISREDFPSLPTHVSKAVSPTPDQREATAFTPNIPTSNSFAILETLSEQTNQTQSTSMLTSPTAAPKRPKKLQPPPPIILSNPADFFSLAKSIQDVCSQNITFKNTKFTKKLQVSSTDDFRAATAFLTSKGVEFHTFKLDEEREIKLVLRGIDSSVGAENVKLALLEEHGMDVLKVAQLTSYRGDNRDSQEARPLLPLYVVYTRDRELANKIRLVTRLCFCRVSAVENFRNVRGPIQCFRCQRYGHTSSFCSNEPRCMKCGNQHSTHICGKERSLPAQCANCKLNHTANYRGCQVYQTAKAKINLPGQPNPAPSQPRHLVDAPTPKVNAWTQRVNSNQPAVPSDAPTQPSPTSLPVRADPRPAARQPEPVQLTQSAPVHQLHPLSNQGPGPQQAFQPNWQAWHHWANSFLHAILAAPHEQRIQVILSRALPLTMIPQAVAMPLNHNGPTP